MNKKSIGVNIAIICLIVLMLQFLGQRFIFHSSAATTQFEVENGVLSNGASNMSDTAASASHYVLLSTLARFASPVTSRIVTVSSNIDGTGSSDVQLDLQNVITNTPNGSIIQFPPNKVYKATTRLKIYGKNNLIIDGGGSRIRNGTTNHTQNESIFDIYNSNNITLRSFIIEGGSTSPGVLIEGTQDQAYGVNIYEASFIEMDHLTFEKIWSDPFQVDGDIWPHDIWMHDSIVTSAGRSGFSVLAGKNIYFERNTIGQVGLHAFNIEPWQATGGGVNVNILNNTVDSYSNSITPDFGVMFAAEGATGSTVTDVTISGNTITKKSLQTQISTLQRRQRIAITNNKSLVTSTPYYGYPSVINLSHVDGVTISGNIQPLSSGTLFTCTDCTGVNSQQ